jgi:hypothetical protein
MAGGFFFHRVGQSSATRCWDEIADLVFAIGIAFETTGPFAVTIMSPGCKVGSCMMSIAGGASDIFAIAGATAHEFLVIDESVRQDRIFFAGHHQITGSQGSTPNPLKG